MNQHLKLFAVEQQFMLNVCFKFILVFQTDISEDELLELKKSAKQKLKIQDLYSNKESQEHEEIQRVALNIKSEPSTPQPKKTTRLGRKVVPPKRLIEESSFEVVIPNKITIKEEVDDWDQDMEVPDMNYTDEIVDR